MFNSETMLWLSQNYIAGTAILTGLLMLIYVGVSLLIVRKARANGDDVCAAGFVPLWRWAYPIKYLVTHLVEKKLEKRKKKMEAEAEDNS